MKNALSIRIFKRSETGIVGAAVLLFAFFAITSSSFLSSYNLFNISRTLSLFTIIALSQAIVLVVGGMNLSVGAIGGLATITLGYLVDVAGVPVYIAAAIAIIGGLLAGAINGAVVTKLKINSFIVTLSTSFVFTGLVYGISKGYPYKNIPKSYTVIGTGSLLGMPILFWILIATLAVMFFVFKYTVFGRELLATGGNAEASRLSGINTDGAVFWAHVLSGFFAAFAGILWVARLGSAQPATGGNWMLISFAISIIGGTGLNGGVISMVSLFAGGVIMVLIKNGLILLEANPYFEQAFLGAIILITVIIDRVRHVLSGRIKKS